jgi:hemin uptake protein HemP
MSEPTAATERSPDERSPVRQEPAVLTSEALFAGRREITIRHGTEQYRLRLTRMNKLILTK